METRPLFTLWVIALCSIYPLHGQVRDPLTFDARHKNASAFFGQSDVVVKFAVTNLSTRPVIISDVALSCGCSVASIPTKPWTIEPGGHGYVIVTTDVQGKRGSLLKTATLLTSSGTRVLTYQVDIIEPATPEERAQNQKSAKADRQAVFRGDCVRCHVEPTRGKFGHELFVAACGICHEAEHRASMVPDLKALKKPTPSAYWLQWIERGKQDGLMPAFSSQLGGPLTEEQIKSLADVLTRTTR